MDRFGAGRRDRVHMLPLIAARPTMYVYTVVLKRLSTGEQAVSFLTRQETKEDARAYAEAAIADDLDLRIVEIRVRNA
jgi:hypothetical protein